MLGRFYRKYRTGAERRGIPFELTQDEFNDIVLRNCIYCGAGPQPHFISEQSVTASGVDRIDNSMGYFPENCVSACKACNMMKRCSDGDDYISQCVMVARHQGRKQ